MKNLTITLLIISFSSINCASRFTKLARCLSTQARKIISQPNNNSVFFKQYKLPGIKQTQSPWARTYSVKTGYRSSNKLDFYHVRLDLPYEYWVDCGFHKIEINLPAKDSLRKTLEESRYEVFVENTNLLERLYRLSNPSLMNVFCILEEELYVYCLLFKIGNEGYTNLKYSLLCLILKDNPDQFDKLFRKKN